MRTSYACSASGPPANTALLKQWLVRWGISTAHLDPRAHRSPTRTATPLAAVMVEGSSYARSNLEARLYKEGLKTPECELCGLGEEWRSRPMSLILQHINGVRDDNRLANLRIVFPNCAATLDTHCGRKNRIECPERECLRCNATFRARYPQQRYCCRECGTRAPRANRGVPTRSAHRAPAIRPAPARDRRDEPLRRRAQVRRLGQRDPQVGAPVRTRTGGRAWTLTFRAPGAPARTG